MLFSGYPTAIEAFRVWAGIRKAPSALAVPSPGGRAEKLRGERLCRRIYGPRYLELRRFMHGLAPELDALMTEVGYGRVLARPGLAVAAREVVTAAALVGAERPRQLRAHLEGCLRVRVTETELRQILRALPGAGAAARREFRRELADAILSVHPRGGP